MGMIETEIGMIPKTIGISIIKRMRRKRETQNAIKIRMILQEMSEEKIIVETVTKKIKAEMRMKRKAINVIGRGIRRNIKMISENILIKKLYLHERKGRKTSDEKVLVKRVLGKKISMTEGSTKAMVIRKNTKMTKKIKIS